MDLISQLPDEIIVDILSLLTIKEAGRSSVLCHRWRDLWKFITSLDFGASMRRSDFFLYVKSVNKFLTLYEGGSSLNKFRVPCDGFRYTYAHDIDEWVKFAISKGVKNLELCFSFFSNSYILSPECFISPLYLSSLKFLTTLSLCWVNVHDQVIENILSNCTNLESLLLKYSKTTKNLKISGFSLNLKHLNITFCQYMESLVLNAPKLVRFYCYNNRKTVLRIGNLPNLIELHIDTHCQAMCDLFLFSSHFEQLHTLQLALNLEVTEEIPLIINLTNLKHLYVDAKSLKNEENIHHLVSLLEAAPCLEMFNLRLAHYYLAPRFVGQKVTSVRPHNGLKNIEMSGVVSERDYEFAAYLLRSAVNLKKMTIRLHSNKQEKLKKFSTKIASEPLPPGAELIIM